MIESSAFDGTLRPADLLPTYRWRIAPAAPASLRDALPDVHPLVLRALVARGVVDPAAIRAFLAHASGDDNPFRIAGMDAAVTRLRRAIRDREPIAVYGDYDADGVTATALLVETLGALGAVQAGPFIPHRERDGYGVHAEALEELGRQGARVVVTVDCGIRAGDEIAAATRAGLDVIVTDHHALPEALPQAVAVINPRRPDCRYGYVDLAGVGLAYKLAQALLRVEARSRAEAAAPGRGGQEAELGRGGQASSANSRVSLDEADLLDLVALGTVADMVPLIGENRALVQRGLAHLRAARRPGIRAMFRAMDKDPAGASARDLGFLVGPRLNAAGRMDDAQTALALLLARDTATADSLALELETRNTARRAATATAVDAVRERLGDDPDRAFILDSSSDIALGVVGLVASRLVDRYYRPAAVLRIEGEIARGSARSIPEFDIVAALNASADLLLRHGGHARAAGFTLRTADIGALEARLSDLAGAQIDGLDLRPTLDITAEVTPADLGWPLLAALGSLEPFGEGNPRPLLLLRGARIGSRRPVGAEGKHLKLSIEGGPGIGSLDAIAFNRGDAAASLGMRADLVFSLGENVWRDQRRLELRVEDLADPA